MNLKATNVLQILQDTEDLQRQLKQHEQITDHRGNRYSGTLEWDIELHHPYNRTTFKDEPIILKKTVKCSKRLDEISEVSMLRFLEINKQIDAWLAGEGEYPVAVDKFKEKNS